MIPSERNPETTSGWANDREVVELTFLLLRDHLSTSERMAAAEEVTVAWLLRRAIRDYLGGEHRRVVWSHTETP